MRSDAQKHRKMLIEAAARVFATQGAGAPLEAVYTEAGLGRGTLYRHFRSRSDLAMAVYEIPLNELLAFVQSHPDDRTLLKEFLGLHRSLATLYHSSAILASFDTSAKLFGELKEKSEQVYRDVLDRSLVSGTVRTGTSIEDIRLATRMLFMASLDVPPSAGDRTVAKAIDILCRGLAPENCNAFDTVLP